MLGIGHDFLQARFNAFDFGTVGGVGTPLFDIAMLPCHFQTPEDAPDPTHTVIVQPRERFAHHDQTIATGCKVRIAFGQAIGQGIGRMMELLLDFLPVGFQRGAMKAAVLMRTEALDALPFIQVEPAIHRIRVAQFEQAFPRHRMGGRALGDLEQGPARSRT